MFPVALDAAMKTNTSLLLLSLLSFLITSGCSSDHSPDEPTVTLLSASDIISAALASSDTTTIHIDQKPVTDDELELLRGNETITNLLLDESLITDDGIRIIATMPNLVHLRVRSKVSDACIDELLKLESLQFLNLPFADFTDNGMEKLATHPQIQLLRIRSPRLTDAAMPAIAAMQNLAFLHLIEVPITNNGLPSLYEADHLQSLYLDDCGTTEEGLSELLKRQPTLHLHVNQTHLDNDPQKHDHDH